MPAISVIVPVYNVEKYLPKCVSSILKQTFSDFELILVDDGSPDGCGVLCDEYAKKDSRVRVIHKKNGGLSDARNVGIDAAKGDYLMFIDSDDWIDVDMLELLYTQAQKYDAQIVECSFRNVFENRMEEETSCSGAVVLGTGIDGIEGILDWKHFKPVAWNKLYHRSVIGDVRYPVGKLHEDEFTTYKYFYRAAKIAYVDVSKYNYVKSRAESITAVYKEKNLDVCFAMRERRAFIEEHQILSLEKKANDIYCFVLLKNLRLCYKNGIQGKLLNQVLDMAKEDAVYYETHPVEQVYREWLCLLAQQGLQEFGKRCEEQQAWF